MEVKPASERWTLALLRSLGDPVHADLISLTHGGYVLHAALRAIGSRLTANQAFVLLARALLGQDEYRNCVASRLPVYDVTGERPELLSAEYGVGGVSSERDMYLLSVVPEPWTAYECARLAVGLGVHRRGIAAAFNLSRACFSGVVAPTLDPAREAEDLLARLHAATQRCGVSRRGR